jgi:hypothetical protein
MLHGSVIVLICSLALSCGNTGEVPDPPREFLEIEVVPKVKDCFISSGSTNVKGDHPAGARLIARSDCRHTLGITIQEVPGIRDLHFADGIVTSRSTKILRNPQLRTLGGLDSLKRTSVLEVKNNPSLRTLEGLDSLEIAKPSDDPLTLTSSTPGTITIEGNDALESVRGLNNLTAANSIVIHNNQNLKSIESLYGMSSLGYLSIRNSPVPQCQIDVFLNELEQPPEEVDVVAVGSGDCTSD